MYAAALRSDARETDFDPLASVRSRGVLALVAHVQDGVTRRARTREEGALRMRFPHERADRLDAVTVNVAGGMAGGDVYDCAFAAEAGARLAVTSTAAEKVYRALGAPTRCDVLLRAEGGAILVYAPQEAILLPRAHRPPLRDRRRGRRAPDRRRRRDPRPRRHGRGRDVSGVARLMAAAP